MATQKEKPVHEVRLGAIKAAIWANNTKLGVRHSVTVKRLYAVESEKGKEWRSSESFGRDDLPLLAKVLDQAHTWVLEHSKART